MEHAETLFQQPDAQSWRASPASQVELGAPPQTLQGEALILPSMQTCKSANTGKDFTPALSSSAMRKQDLLIGLLIDHGQDHVHCPMQYCWPSQLLSELDDILIQEKN